MPTSSPSPFHRVFRQLVIAVGLVGFMYFTYEAMVSYVQVMADRQAVEQDRALVAQASDRTPAPDRIDGIRDPLRADASPKQVARQTLAADEAEIVVHRTAMWRQLAGALGVPLLMGLLALLLQRRARVRPSTC